MTAMIIIGWIAKAIMAIWFVSALATLPGKVGKEREPYTQDDVRRMLVTGAFLLLLVVVA